MSSALTGTGCLPTHLGHQGRAPLRPVEGDGELEAGELTSATKAKLHCGGVWLEMTREQAAPLTSATKAELHCGQSRPGWAAKPFTMSPRPPRPSSIAATTRSGPGRPSRPSHLGH